MQFLDINGLKAFLDKLKNILGYKNALEMSMNTRREYLLNIDYERDLSFNVNAVLGQVSSVLDDGILDTMILE